jgi:hypothetical protein
MQKKVLRYYRTFDNEFGLWLTFAIYASDRPNTAQGVATIVPIGESAWGGRIQTNHVVAVGGAVEAMAKAIKHLDSIFGADGEGLEKLEDIM